MPMVVSHRPSQLNLDRRILIFIFHLIRTNIIKKKETSVTVTGS
jgi:hypothetical protein